MTAPATRFRIDHRAGGRARETEAVDDAGRTVLHVKADWAITDDHGRSVLFVAPELARQARASLFDGLINGLLGVDMNNIPADVLRNVGPGRQTVRRAVVPMRGIPVRWTRVAAVTREAHGPADSPPAYDIERQDGGEAGLRFVATPDPAATPQTTGFADPRYARYELRHADGRPIIQHAARIGSDRSLEQSTFVVTDPSVPTDEAVILCLARFQAWRA
ncbi:MAG: hypothetical protein HY263_07685 [Chloroflexi bacterium]|nr:hypothetical protein [Chloroflexota bacterium]